MHAHDTFRIEHGALIRSVIPRKGKPYEHACTLAVYEAVAHAIDELEGEPTALDELVAQTGLPHSQVNVAMAFLKERGCIVPVRGRKHAAADGGAGCVHLDAMTEYHALKDGSPGT
jgi:predicted Rossmann fold nucleotide-binding protein DprA/Smf involved in DNA uptake